MVQTSTVGTKPAIDLTEQEAANLATLAESLLGAQPNNDLLTLLLDKGKFILEQARKPETEDKPSVFGKGWQSGYIRFLMENLLMDTLLEPGYEDNDVDMNSRLLAEAAREYTSKPNSNPA
ncbi:hypothetical protein G7067_05220 [Leucobacter insecticola]|uniref:Uncharacterized protein n=1 Tax=Leucobacter insecticola TaxID=2714934 RepID=A0A6G8FHW5_9MICO|nr:hypothetical protein [Leucobacter insecticola]QIM15954.1 hypothetical protein G7067_05220 [Leucobacter insecticola]